MNRLFQLTLTFALTCTVLISSGQSQSDKSLQKQILGTWKFLEITLELTDKATQEEKSMVETGIGKTMSMFMENLSYTFKKNGQYEMNNDDTITKGTWQITQGKLKMISDTESKSDDKPVNITLAKNRLTLSSDKTEGIVASMIFENQK